MYALAIRVAKVVPLVRRALVRRRDQGGTALRRPRVEAVPRWQSSASTSSSVGIPRRLQSWECGYSSSRTTPCSAGWSEHEGSPNCRNPVSLRRMHGNEYWWPSTAVAGPAQPRHGHPVPGSSGRRCGTAQIRCPPAPGSTPGSRRKGSKSRRNPLLQKSRTQSESWLHSECPSSSRTKMLCTRCWHLRMWGRRRRGAALAT